MDDSMRTALPLTNRRGRFDEEAPRPPTTIPLARRIETARRRRPAVGSNAAPPALRTGDAKAQRLMDRDKIEKLKDDGDMSRRKRSCRGWYWQLPAEREKLSPH